MSTIPRVIRPGLCALTALTAAFTLSTLIPGAGAFWTTWVYNGAFVLAAVLCAARAVAPREEQLAWAALALGLSFSAAGEIVLSTKPSQPVPGPSDLLLLAFYPLAYVAIAGLLRSRVRGAGAGRWLDGVISGLALAALVATLAFEAVATGAGERGFALATELAYPIGDLLLILLVAGVFGVSGGRPGSAWTLLGAGMLAWAVSDALCLAVPGTPVDAGRLLGGTLAAWAAWRPRTAQFLSATDRRAVAVPALSTLAAGGLLLGCALGNGHRLGVLLGAGALIAAVARTVLTFRDVQRLAETRRLAHTDELTGLANRRALLARLSAAVAADEPVALALFDIDHFKELNDTLGHQVGDQLLVQVGLRIAPLLREQDLLSRLGGDEFAIVLAGSLDVERATAVTRRVAERLEQPFELDGIAVGVDASFGIALRSDHAVDAATLLRHADVAMYAAKSGRTGTEVYAPVRDDRDGRDRLRMASELRTGIGRGELEIQLQPQVALADSEIVGVEALVRWRHPELGLLPPGMFLPAVAQTSAMRQITRRVLEAALVVATARPGLRVSVNVTALDLLDGGFPALVESLLASSGAPPEQLCLEVTEDAVMSDGARAVAVLERLRACGVGLSLDDFGTGHSSLGRLLELPVDELKIDRSFVQGIGADERNLAIIRAAATLGADLGLTVVAEGIENDAAREAVARAGCHVVQGFLLSAPLPVWRFDGWAAAHRVAMANPPGGMTTEPRPLSYSRPLVS